MPFQLIATAARRFQACERGNFAVIAAVMAIPLVGLTGVAVDYSRIESTRGRLQSSVDAAIVAAAASGEKVASMQALASDFVEANFAEPGVMVETTVDNYSMRVDAVYRLDLPVMAAFGKPQVEIKASAQIDSKIALRGGSAQSGASAKPQSEDPRIRRARRQLEEATRKMPGDLRQAHLREFEAMLKQMQQADGGNASTFHLSR